MPFINMATVKVRLLSKEHIVVGESDSPDLRQNLLKMELLQRLKDGKSSVKQQI